MPPIARRVLRTLTLLMVMLPVACGSSGSGDAEYLTRIDVTNLMQSAVASMESEPDIARRVSTDQDWVVLMEEPTFPADESVDADRRWAYMGITRSLLMQSPFSTNRAVVWTVPAGDWQDIADALNLIGEPADLRRPPTHRLQTTFQRGTPRPTDDATDYRCSFVMTSVDGGQTWAATIPCRNAPGS